MNRSAATTGRCAPVTSQQNPTKMKRPIQTTLHSIRNSSRIPLTLLIAAAASFEPVTAHTAATVQDRPLLGGFSERCRVGGPTAPEWAYFEDRSPVEFDAAGNLHILDDGAGRIVVVDSQCNLVRTVGRKGEGPGEFNRAVMFAVWRDGRVAVMDLGHSAYQIFGSGGEFEHFVRMGTDQGPMAMFSGMRLAIRPDPSGDALIAQGPAAAMDRMAAAMAQMLGARGQEEGVDDRGLERIDLTGDVVSAIPVLQSWRASREAADELDPADLSNPTAMMGSMMNDRIGFQADFHWDLLPDGTIVWSDSTAYAIKFARPGGPVFDVVERPFSPEPVTTSLRQQTIERRLAALEEDSDDPRVAAALEMAALMPGMEAAMRNAIGEMEFHDEVPVVRGLKTTWEGGVWVRRRGEEPWDDDGPIDVFDPERAYLGTFDPSSVEIPDAFGPGGLIAYWEFDEFDVPTIVLKRLSEGVR